MSGIPTTSIKPTDEITFPPNLARGHTSPREKTKTPSAKFPKSPSVVFSDQLVAQEKQLGSSPKQPPNPRRRRPRRGLQSNPARRFVPDFSRLFRLRIDRVSAMDAPRPAAHSLDRTEINWDKLDKTKFYVVGAGLFTGVTVALYPMSVVKTRLQVATFETAERTAFSIFKNILKTDGIHGLYRGFGTVITGAIPARIIFLTSLETTKIGAFKVIEGFNFSEPTKAAIANGIAGMTGSLMSQAVFVPIDVVSQKLMVQGYSGYTQYNGGFDVVRKVIKAEGIRGLYRGFGLSAMTYSPSSAVWWATYGSSQRLLWKLLGYGNDSQENAPSELTVISVQATGGIVAGAVASCITTPLDTIKTRLQVMEHENRESARQVVRSLVREDGWKGLYRGLGPRFVSMSAWGTSMILAYEYLKRLCAIEEEACS